MEVSEEFRWKYQVSDELDEVSDELDEVSDEVDGSIR